MGIIYAFISRFASLHCDVYTLYKWFANNCICTEAAPFATASQVMKFTGYNEFSRMKWELYICMSMHVDVCYCPGGCTTKLAEHTQAFLGKPGLLNTKLAIRVKRFHEAHLK